MADPGEWHVLKKADFTWRLRSGAPLELIDRLIELRTHPNPDALIVKQNPRRTVFRLQAAGRTYYAKWHRYRGPWNALLDRIRGTRAQREWTMTAYLQKKGLPVVTPVLLAEQRKSGFPVESFLVTLGIDGTSFAETARTGRASSPPLPPFRRRTLTRRLGELVRSLHHSHVHHPDLHGDNILISPPQDRLCLLDLHAARPCNRLSRARRIQSLAFLCNSFAPHNITGADRLRFLKSCAPDEDPRALSAAVARKSEQILARHIRSRSRRCMVRGKVFTNDRTPRGHVFRRRSISLEDVFRVVALHRRIMSRGSEGAVVKRSTKTNITRLTFPDAGDLGCLYVKEFVRSGLLRLLPRRLRHQPALVSWRASLAMAVRGIPAPQALALLVGRGPSSYLIMRAVLQNAEPLAEYLRRAMGPQTPVPKRRSFVRAAADFLRKTYAAGVLHRDLKSGNILVRESDGGTCEFVLLDLAPVTFVPRIHRGWKILNLAQLNASTPLELTWTDRLRFLRLLAQDDPDLATRPAMQAIARITNRRARIWARP